MSDVAPASKLDDEVEFVDLYIDGRFHERISRQEFEAWSAAVEAAARPALQHINDALVAAAKERLL